MWYHLIFQAKKSCLNVKNDNLDTFLQLRVITDFEYGKYKKRKLHG